MGKNETKPSAPPEEFHGSPDDNNSNLGKDFDGDLDPDEVAE